MYTYYAAIFSGFLYLVGVAQFIAQPLFTETMARTSNPNAPNMKDMFTALERTSISLHSTKSGIDTSYASEHIHSFFWGLVRACLSRERYSGSGPRTQPSREEHGA